MSYLAVVGLEIHMQLLSKTKLFSYAPTSFGKKPNSQVSPLDMAFPGAMPSVNKSCVVSALRMANALHMRISNVVSFDRKNYFYSDLAKGYQLTQFFNPLGREGYLTISTPKGEKKIRINRLHLEEDTAKQIHLENETLLDFNRAGIGLIEIVTAPDIRSGKEAEQFVRQINRLATKLKVTNNKLQEGTLRVDVNISLQKEDRNEIGVAVELKNLNGFKNIRRAIDVEIKRQKQLLESGERLLPETRRYDETQNMTVFMRYKKTKKDYHYFTDANIAPIKLSKKIILEALNTPEKKDPLENYPLRLEDKTIISRSPYLKKLFLKLVKNGVTTEISSNLLIGKIQASIKKYGVNKVKKIEKDTLDLLLLYQEEKLTFTQVSAIYDELLTNKSLEEIYNSGGYSLKTSDEQLSEIIDEVLLECDKAIQDYRLGKDKSLNYIIGKIYKRTNNNVDPIKTKELLLKKLEEK